MQRPPLVVGLVRNAAAKRVFQQGDISLLTVPTAKRLLTAEFPGSPRLFLIEATKQEVQITCEVVVQLRHQYPLTDVLIWAPHASSSTVRSLFHAGVKDVILRQSEDHVLGVVQSVLQDQQILPRLNELTKRKARNARFESMLSRSETMWDLFELCERIAQTNATVLIAGETGTGKELIARAVHRRSGRGGRFVAANCASIPQDLINSELFGHEKGAFTGADRAKKGLVTHAGEGTLFLDEIGDMPAEGQLSLLRMLQEKRVRPVGSLSESEIDVRVVAATNVDLHADIKAGNFREDLYYRLDVIRMNVPALRERPEDILFLFGHFIKKNASHYGLQPPSWSDSFLDALVQYDWPGNIRQLQNFSERLVLSRTPKALTARDFDRIRSTVGDELGSETPRSRMRLPDGVDTSKSLQENIQRITSRVERDYLTALLEKHHGRVIETAKDAGISRRTLLRKMNRYNLEKSTFKR
ncbi:MAG: sigma-54-dependent Fis family transcriptional regulator [Planctomycetales bacterium]|nr:sigma-54-dependent Fis family transcriptional regulator [Planctomycetales bacterium]